MYAYGYEAKGDATTDICFFGFDKNGNKIEECWIKGPYSGITADFVVNFRNDSRMRNLEELGHLYPSPALHVFGAPQSRRETFHVG
jgi:hypothetical protein